MPQGQCDELCVKPFLLLTLNTIIVRDAPHNLVLEFFFSEPTAPTPWPNLSQNWKHTTRPPSPSQSQSHRSPSYLNLVASPLPQRHFQCWRALGERERMTHYIQYNLSCYMLKLCLHVTIYFMIWGFHVRMSIFFFHLMYFTLHNFLIVNIHLTLQTKNASIPKSIILNFEPTQVLHRSRKLKGYLVARFDQDLSWI